MGIFLSSTILDLKDLRNTLIHELKSDGHEVIASENGTVLVNLGKNSYEQCLAAVAECDYLIAIIDKRFGGEYPHESRQSITDSEIEEASISRFEQWILALSSAPYCWKIFILGLIFAKEKQ